VYQRELKKAGATLDDAAELRVLRHLIQMYKHKALVPVGTRWAEVPNYVQTSAREQRDLSLDDPLIEPVRSGPPRIVGLLLLPLAGLVLLFLFNTLGSSGTNADAVALNITPSVTPSPTPEIRPTPTPLALEDADRVIRDGEPRSSDYYPVLLQIYPNASSRSRVFVVQERLVETADWRFDPNPDVASWVSGLIVRPVLGIPFSEDNRAFMASLGTGARFDLQMNTGAVLSFTYDTSREVVRQSSAIFRQDAPGLVLVLIGEYGPDGLLTGARQIITASYEAEQEISNLATQEVPLALPTPQPEPARTPADVILHLERATYDANQLYVEARLFNPHQQSIRLEDSPILHLSYAVDVPGIPVTPLASNWPAELAAGEAFPLKLTFTYTGEPFARLFLLEREYALQIHQPYSIERTSP
jgi:hypothetical protein